MKKIISIFILFVGSFLFANVIGVTPISEDINNSNALFICDKLEDTKLFFSLINKNKTKEFYQNYCKDSSKRIIWFNKNGNFTKQSLELIKSIKSSYFHGLNPSKYHKNKILYYAPKIIDNQFNRIEDRYYSLNRVDVLLTDAYITLAHDLYYGFSDWNKIIYFTKLKKKKFQWDRNPYKIDMLNYLLKYQKENRVLESLINLLPDFDEYYRLIEVLKYYRSLREIGGWDKIPEGKSIRINSRDKRIPLIKKRLYITGDLAEIENPKNIKYNENSLIKAVKFFQTRHNIKADGIIGPKTLSALNISLVTKINKIILNLERYRWLPRGVDKSLYIDVNIPSFKMHVLQFDNEIFSMDIIVGKKKRPTPVLFSDISYIVLNPYWTAPKTIVKEDILKKADNIIDYVESHNMNVYKISPSGKAKNIDVYDVNWSNYINKKYVPFMFKAKPGVKNPLGIVKFMFPNRYSVYMHDTNSKRLFKKEKRSYSSGCVRLHKPIKLLKYLINEDGEDYSKIENILKKGKNHRIYLKNKIPLFFRYMTTSVDKNYNTYFYDDIYGYDTIQIAAIKNSNKKLLK